MKYRSIFGKVYFLVFRKEAKHEVLLFFFVSLSQKVGSAIFKLFNNFARTFLLIIQEIKFENVNFGARASKVVGKIKKNWR